MVATHEELFTVADTSSLWCYVQIFEKDLSRIRVGNKVNIKVDAYPEERFSGIIDYIADTLDTSKRTARGRVRINNPQGHLKAGMFATLTVGTGQRDSLLVPESAILTTTGESFVFVEMAPGLYQKHCIKPGMKANGQVEILEGVEQGAKVVVKGGFTLKSELEKGAFQGCSGGPGHAH
jgi:RND family efflux transporter MFP subunit